MARMKRKGESRVKSNGSNRMSGVPLPLTPQRGSHLRGHVDESRVEGAKSPRSSKYLIVREE